MKLIGNVAGEAFIPLAYGGGISTIDEIKALFYLGVEKVILNYTAVHNPALITAAAKLVGSQSVVASIDVKKNLLGKYRVCTKNATETINEDPAGFARKMQEAGAGEIFINSVERDGTYSGYDLELVQRVSVGLTIPVIVCGGASAVTDFALAVKQGASAVAAGSMFVFQRTHRAVLINYPSQNELKEKLFTQIV